MMIRYKAWNFVVIRHKTPIFSVIHYRWPPFTTMKFDVIGGVQIRVWRDDLICSLDCKIVDSKTVHPLLGHSVCGNEHYQVLW